MWAHGAVVGSANLSEAALSETDNSGQDEAGFLVTVPSHIEEIRAWFKEMWTGSPTRPITKDDLVKAKKRWDERPKSQKKGDKKDLEFPPWPQGDTVKALDAILKEVDPSLEFLPVLLAKYKCMNVGRNHKLLVPEGHSYYKQPIRLTVNEDSVKITALMLQETHPRVRKDAKERVDKAGLTLGSETTEKARKHPAVRVEGITEQKLDSPLVRDAIRYLFEQSMCEWREANEG